VTPTKNAALEAAFSWALAPIDVAKAELPTDDRAPGTTGRSWHEADERELTHENGEDFAAWSNTGKISPAEAFDRLVGVLVNTRSTMEPKVPDHLPMLVKAPPQVDNPGWQWSIEGDGSLVLNLRHPGLGWLGFRMRDVDGFSENLANVIDQRNALQQEFTPPHR
jgi:hypothetical protein